MKRLFLITLYSFCVLTTWANTRQMDPTLTHLNTLLENSDYITLKNELQKLPRSFNSNPYLYFDAFCFNAFNQYGKSIIATNQLLTKYGKQLKRNELLKLLNLQGRNFNNTYQYALAANVYQTILQEYSEQLSESELSNYKNLYTINATLAKAHVKPQIKHQEKEHTIPIYHNIFNHLMLPVSSNGKHEHFVFDTGAMVSTVSESTAKKLGLHIYETDINVNTATHISIKTKLGVAEKLMIGDLLFENVVFLVTNDEDLNFPKFDYSIPGIIGLPILMQMEEMQINLNDNSLLVPLKPSTRDFTNLFMLGNTPVVEMRAGTDILHMALDTGARNSELSRKYFDKNRQEIELKGEKQTVGRGSAGGSIEEEVYFYPNFKYRIGTKTNVLEFIAINLSDYQFLKNLDGNLGQDVSTQYDYTIINFKSMFLDFK